jgi:hypothetical protein
VSDAHPTTETMALFSAFLDGELDAVAERDLLRRLEQEPGLSDALDALADTIARAQRALHNDRDDVDILAAVLAQLPADDLASAEAAETLTWLVADGEATVLQAARLDTLLNQYPEKMAEALVHVHATQAVLAAPAQHDAVQAELARVPDHVGARVARTERAWSLAAGAADGALEAAEVEELAGLCGGDGELLAAFEGAVAARQPGGADHAAAEALLAFAESEEVHRCADRAGAAALQVIAAEAAQTTQATPAQVNPSGRADPVLAPSVWARLRGVFGGGWVPALAATAAVLGVVVFRDDPTVQPEQPVPVATADTDTDTDTDTGATRTRDELTKSFVDALGPVALASNTALPDAEDLPVLADNGADVESIDAAGNTVVFQTAESNITVIWVAGLNEDSTAAQEQGT